MIPNTDSALRMLSQRLMTQLLPDLKSTYSLSDGALLGLLMNAVADETEAGIDRRMTDIAEMQSLLSEAGRADHLKDEKPSSFRLKDVNDLHDRLTRALIDIQAEIEQQDPDGALNRQIWDYLHRHALRHVIRAVP